MPTYDYECDACSHSFELFQSIMAEPEKKCPECGKRKLRRLIGPGAAIVFKGSGFYKTDYRSESYKKAAAADTSGSSSSKSEGKSESKSKGKSESKSDGKSESKSSDSKPAASKSSKKSKD